MSTEKYDNQQKAEEFVRRVIGNKADYYDDLSQKYMYTNDDKHDYYACVSDEFRRIVKDDSADLSYMFNYDDEEQYKSTTKDISHAAETLIEYLLSGVYTIREAIDMSEIEKYI